MLRTVNISFLRHHLTRLRHQLTSSAGEFYVFLSQVFSFSDPSCSCSYFTQPFDQRGCLKVNSLVVWGALHLTKNTGNYDCGKEWNNTFRSVQKFRKLKIAFLGNRINSGRKPEIPGRKSNVATFCLKLCLYTASLFCLSKNPTKRLKISFLFSRCRAQSFDCLKGALCQVF